MNETIRKLRPTDYWRIGEHESWFAYMASKGLYLKKLGKWSAKFVKGEPKQMKYRIEVCDKPITSEQREMYSESGWDYVTTCGSFNIFSSPVELNAPELHTDPAEQSYTLKELDKQFISDAIIMVVAILGQIWMMYDIYFRGSTYILNLIEGRLIQQISLIILYSYVVYNSIKAAISIRTLQKTLYEGIPINHNSPWKNRGKIRFMIYTILFFGITISPFIQTITSKTLSIQQAPANLPIIRLNDIEQDSILAGKPQIYYDSSNIDEGHIYYNCNFFAPIQYHFSEYSRLPDEVEKYESGMYYSPSININVYNLRFPSMGKELISDLIKKHSLKYKKSSFTEINNIDFDQLVVLEGENNFKEIFALKGKGIIHVRYWGYADNDSIIKNIAQKIDLISN